MEEDLCMAFMDLDKPHDKTDKIAMWEVLQVYRVGWKLLKPIKKFYKENKACLRVGREQQK